MISYSVVDVANQCRAVEVVGELNHPQRRTLPCLEKSLQHRQWMAFGKAERLSQALTTELGSTPVEISCEKGYVDVQLDGLNGACVMMEKWAIQWENEMGSQNWRVSDDHEEQRYQSAQSKFL